MNKLIGVSIFLFSITAFAQTDLSPVNCGTLDAISCNDLQKKETARINKENKSKLVEAFKNCSPIKSPVYLLTKLMRTTIIDGKIGDKCKVIIAQSSVPAQQVCLFDQKAMSLISKDPQTYTQEEQILSSTLFNQQCKNEIVGESKEAIEMRKINKEIEENMDDLKSSMKDKIVNDMNKEISVKKLACVNGNKNSCSELDEIKKQLQSDCKKPEMTELCKRIQLP